MTSKEIQDDNKKVPSRETRGALFEIRVKGQLNDQWRDWFENMELKSLENGDMILCGAITDQAALMGILNNLNRLNLKLLSVNEVSQTKSNVEKEKE